MDQIVSLAFRSVFPLLMLMSCGIVLRAKGMICDSTIRQLNGISTRFFIPCLLFNNVYSADLKAAFNYRLFLLELGCVLTVSAVLYMLVPRVVQDRKRQFSLCCCLYWPNCTMFGLPILTSLCGTEGTLVGTIMIVTIAPFFSAGSIIFLEKYRGGERVSARGLLRRIFANPMLWGSMLGIGCSLLGIRLPAVVLSPVRTVANIATPLALICLGAFCKWGSFHRLLKPVFAASLVKLVAVPGFALTVGLLCGYRGLQLLGLMIVFASPSAVSTFSIAEPEFADCELSALLVSFTSLLSVISYFLWIILFHALGL